MSRVVFVNRFAPPDLSATAQLLGDLAGALAENFTVTIVAGDQDYHPGTPKDATEARPGESGPANPPTRYQVVRLRTSRFGRARLAGRAIDYLTYHCAALWWLLRNLRAGDVVVALTDPPLVSVTAGLAAMLRGARLVNWVQDLFPEVALQLGQPRGLRFVAAPLRAMRNWSLRRASANVAIGERMAELLMSARPRGRMVVIHNWAHEEAGAPPVGTSNALRLQLSMQDAFVVMYAGNLGRAHDAGTLLEAAEHLRAEADVAFLVLGEGHGNAWLREQVRTRGTPNIRFAPYQPLSELGDTLGAGDLHLVTLRPELEGMIVPSKFYGIAAAGRPMAFIGDAGGELAGIIRAADCGIVVRPGDSRGLADGILKLRDSGSEARRMGSNGRALLDREFSRVEAVARWSELLASLTTQGPGPATFDRQRSEAKP